MRCFLAVIALILSVGSASSYTFQPVQFETCVGIFSLNNRNQLLGNECNGHNAFVWTDGNIDPIQVPGSIETSARGFNDKGQVVGSYTTEPTGIRHGFIWTGKTFVTLDPPGSIFAEATDINNKGQVVGWWIDQNERRHGFLWNGKTFTTIEAPAPFEIGEHLSINKKGHILSTYLDGFFHQIFLLIKGRYQVIEFETAARAFNDRDQILIISDREIRLWEDGEIKTFDPAEGFLSAEDINARGQIVGQSGVDGFVFELRNAKFTTFALPGATETSPQLINANGVIFGESELGFFLAFPEKEKRKK